MNHNPSGDLANASPSSQSVVERRSFGVEERLNTALHQALGCLDVKLEDELTILRHKQTQQVVDLPSMVTSEATWEESTLDSETDDEILTAEIVQPEFARTNGARVDLDPPQSSGFIIINGLPTPKTNLTAITTVNYAPVASQGEDGRVNRLDLNFATGGDIATFHDEYSPSSQELLRQIQSGYTNSTDAGGSRTGIDRNPPKRKIFTPIKVGSMAVVCMLAGGAAYTYFNPTILAPLLANKAATPTANIGLLGQSIQSPNLAANEFTDLNLSTINTVKMPAPATATNVSTATTPIATSTTTAPAAIPFNGMNSPGIAPTTIISQPRLADSLVKSLLPANFHTFKPQTRYPANQPQVGR
jgi:hypothetical protein